MGHDGLRRTTFRKAFLAPWHPLVEQCWLHALADAQRTLGFAVHHAVRLVTTITSASLERTEPRRDHSPILSRHELRRRQRCTVDRLRGSAATCDAVCQHAPAGCTSGDGYCPDGCTYGRDQDCAAFFLDTDIGGTTYDGDPDLDGANVAVVPVSEQFTTIALIDSSVLGVAGTIGSGRVVFLGDEWTEFDSEWSTMPPVIQFWNNLVRWLSRDETLGIPRCD